MEIEWKKRKNLLNETQLRPGTILTFPFLMIWSIIFDAFSLESCLEDLYKLWNCSHHRALILSSVWSLMSCRIFSFELCIFSLVEYICWVLSSVFLYAYNSKCLSYSNSTLNFTRANELFCPFWQRQKNFKKQKSEKWKDLLLL